MLRRPCCTQPHLRPDPRAVYRAFRTVDQAVRSASGTAPNANGSGGPLSSRQPTHAIPSHSPSLRTHYRPVPLHRDGLARARVGQQKRAGIRSDPRRPAPSTPHLQSKLVSVMANACRRDEGGERAARAVCRGTSGERSLGSVRSLSTPRAPDPSPTGERDDSQGTTLTTSSHAVRPGQHRMMNPPTPHPCGPSRP